MKCKVQNIAVDISVNQIGGPNKVYFLEKVIVIVRLWSACCIA